MTGYPTLKFFPAGSAEAQPYESARELEDMVEFVNAQAGTERAPDGGLKASAGRLAVLDELIAAAHYVVDEALLSSLKAAAQDISESKAAKKAAAYVAAAEKVLAKGADYVEKEVARLGSMVAKGTIKPESRAMFQQRQNTLMAFLNR